MSLHPADPDLDSLSRPPKRTKLDHADTSMCSSARVTSKTEPRVRLSHNDYTLGWISALHIELAAACSMLEERHQKLENLPNDDNVYEYGRIGTYDIVLACLPAGVFGTTSAATIATKMSNSFPHLKMRLMVGVGGEVPDQYNDVRLGDVVVSTQTKRCPAVIQYDFGRTVEGGSFERTGALNKPPPLLFNAVNSLSAEHDLNGNRLSAIMHQSVRKCPRMATRYTHQGQQQDLLFEADYEHVNSEAACNRCDRQKLVQRPSRHEDALEVFYGPIASANQIMEHGQTRDRLVNELGIMCFEMEAAGLMDNFPCLVIRGISDYADSHKRYQWHGYAAMAAAAYAKELILAMSGSERVNSSLEISSDTSTQSEQV